jgi:DNA mismatch repair protein MutS2
MPPTAIHTLGLRRWRPCQCNLPPRTQPGFAAICSVRTVFPNIGSPQTRQTASQLPCLRESDFGIIAVEMEDRTLRVLEYDKIRAMLAERAACSLGRDMASQLAPSTDLTYITERQFETSEACEIILSVASFPLGGIRDIRSHVVKAEREAVLQPQELLEVAGTLSSARRLRSFLVKLSTPYPRLAAIGGRIDSFSEVEEQVNRAISSAGEVIDSASDALARVRSDLRSVRGRLMDRLHSILQSSQYRNALQEPIITIRDDRYCVPVKSEYRSQLPGIVHDASASGATVFVEPASVVELGNDLKQLAVKEQDEIEKVLRALTRLIMLRAQEIHWTVETLAEIDFISARARLSLDQNAVKPGLNRSGRTRLFAARHPLLTGEVVPIDLELGRRFRTLLITGPNTGGKTVTLKTVGLLTLMAQSGLHVPAGAGTEIAVFDQIFADIGDEQSIEQSLSTFSSHIGNIVRFLKEIRPDTLVLLDEIGAGTDPDEGAALAKAIIEYLMDRGARIVATTHYGELKEFAYLYDGVENASVEFDIETLRPTYHLMIGVPGSSNAFAIASRLGMTEDVVKRAQSFVSGRQDSSDEMIRRIEESHRAAIEERRDAEQAATDAEIIRDRYEEELRKLESARDKLEDRIRSEGRELIERYTKRLDKAMKELRSYKREGKRTQVLQQEITKAFEEIQEETVVSPEEQFEEQPLTGHVFRKGETVFIASLNQVGTVLDEAKGDSAMVQIGSMRVAVPVETLRPTRQKPREEAISSVAEGVSLEKVRNISPELKLIAQRAEPAVDNLDKYLDGAMAAGLRQVRIIHGRGTGALKKAVWDYLRGHPGVESFRLGEDNEGGSGATIVELKQ